VLLPEPVRKGFAMLAPAVTANAFLIGDAAAFIGAALLRDGNGFNTGAFLIGALAAACCTLGKTLLAI
jgi:hypothetical protein